MHKILLGLGALLMTSQLTTAAYSINNKLLNLEAETFSSKIWSGVSIQKNRIKESLGFLSETDVADIKSSQPPSFKSFYEKITSQVQDKKFLQFARECNSIYEEENDLITKLAVQLLLEKVTEKYAADLHKVEKLKEVKAQMPNNRQQSDRDRIFNIFLNADKNISVN